MENNQQEWIIEQFEILRQQKIEEYYRLKVINNRDENAYDFQIQEQKNAPQKYYQLDVLEIVYDRRELYSNKIRNMQRNKIFEERRNLHKIQLEENQLCCYKEEECFKIDPQFIGLLEPHSKYEVVQASQESDLQLAVEICKLNLHEGIELNFPTFIHSDSINQISRLEQQYSQLLQLYQQYTNQSQSSQESNQLQLLESQESSSQISLTSHHSSQSYSQEFQIERIRQLIIRVIYDLESINSSQTYGFSEFSDSSILDNQNQLDDDQHTETDDY